MFMTSEREDRLRSVANRRQTNLTVILENVHDPHNIGAVMRSCDAVGLAEIYLVNTEDRVHEKYLSVGKTASAGTRKWIDIQYFRDLDACFSAVRQKYQYIYATHMSAESKSLYELDLTDSVALLFGNEHEGVSQAALQKVDGNFLIPQVGMVQSLNISVACAVSLYEAFRQRNEKDFYGENNPATTKQSEAIFQSYVKKHDERLLRRLK